MLVSVSSSLRTGAGKESLGQTFEGIELENFLAQQKKRKSEEKEKNLNYKKLKRWQLDRAEEVIRFICVTEIQT